MEALLEGELEIPERTEETAVRFLQPKRGLVEELSLRKEEK